MYTLTIGNNTLKRYKVQWHDYNGIGHYVKKTVVLHATTLDNAKDKAERLYGSIPDTVCRI